MRFWYEMHVSKVIFNCMIFHSLLFFQNLLFRKMLSIKVSNKLNQDKAWHFVGPGLGPNFSEKLASIKTCKIIERPSQRFTGIHKSRANIINIK